MREPKTACLGRGQLRLASGKMNGYRINLDEMSMPFEEIKGICSPTLENPRMQKIGFQNLSVGAKEHLFATLNSKRLIVTTDEYAATELVNDLRNWGVNAVYVPYKDDVLTPRENLSSRNLRERISSLYAIAAGKADAVIVSADALTQRFPKRELILKFCFSIKKDDVISPQNLAEKLAHIGYTRRDAVGDNGEFALHGDILDVLSDDGKLMRISFFDETVEYVKELDKENLSVKKEVDELLFLPKTDVLLDENGYKSAVFEIKRYLTYKNAQSVMDKLSVGASPTSTLWALPFMEDSTESILDFCKNMRLLILDEPKMIANKIALLSKEFSNRIDYLLESKDVTPKHKTLGVSLEQVKRKIENLRILGVTYSEMSGLMFAPTMLLRGENRAVTKYYYDTANLVREVMPLILNGAKVLFACGDAPHAENIERMLNDLGLPTNMYMGGELKKNAVNVSPFAIPKGVLYPAHKLMIVGTSECVGKWRTESKEVTGKELTAVPKPNDYVVHKIHGVGICRGVSKAKFGDYEREYVDIEYRDGDMLHVAVDQMDNLGKFVGEENPTLNKMGGREFSREKEAVRASVKKLAIDLVNLYALREQKQGFKYSADTPWQKQFEDDFEYEETPDQIKAIQDVKTDMESGRLMDRLVVGDVGFGKTEVAFRAMFKAAMDGRQSAILAPTTILARQHYENLRARLERFGIECALLTRMQDAKEIKRVKEGLYSGDIPMVVATHKMLSKSVIFKNLGLLVLDEEQRFGVEHKETIKERYPDVDVLTLSATPIPRTLNMSLMGIRDISALKTPPKNRIPVQTYVTPYSDSLLRDAIERELARGGQTFIVLNNISALDNMQSTVMELCPKARVIVAHGQMPAEQLEKRMSAFYDKKFDVLIATTIIENGIDIPDANTLIVINSDNFGLSQLHQLRGRVGRRGTLAHAFFTVPESGIISGNAEARLKALSENWELGSGFNIAMEDLSIRGAGALLGAKQSGHIQKIGYEMYLEILNDAIQEIKTGVKKVEERDVTMFVDVPAFTDDMLFSTGDKIRIYKKITAVKTVADRNALIEEITSAYGKIGQPFINLIDVSLLKNLVKKFGISKVYVNKTMASVAFYENDTLLKNVALGQAVAESGGKVYILNTIPTGLAFIADGLKNAEKLRTMIKFFSEIE